ncbi:hypothetical protein BT93_K2267 [Corymbia citriodora subsp. variegata]|nr:hypothetical protein BT93_K2267 [Corymbia citriodora subsp. variegata]
MGRPSTELFAPCSAVHQQMRAEEASDPSAQQQFQMQQNIQTSPIDQMQAVQFPPQNPQMMPLHVMPQSNPQNLAGPGQIPQANQSFGPQPALYSGQPIPVSSQIQAGFQPLHTVPGFTTGPMNAPAQPFHTAGIIVQLPPAAPPSPWTTGLFDCMDDPLNGTLRSRFNLIESPATDWITHFFCECCALSQEYRELKNRGLDPSIGKTDGNASTMQNVQYQVAMVPPMHQQPMRA